MAERLYNDPDLTQFYDIANRWWLDFDLCAKLARHADSVLDLGCGTGELAAALSENRSVTGVDPAAAMLEHARKRPGGDRVTWVEGDACTVRLDERFDLIVLTGHAFQVFLTIEDQRALLTTIAHHLTEKGRFIFDTRNPLTETWKTWTPDLTRRSMDHDELGPIERWTESSFDAPTNVLTYTTIYVAEEADKRYSAASQILFTPKEELEALIGGAGLEVERWLGDWEEAPWTPASPEIIPIGRRAS